MRSIALCAVLFPSLAAAGIDAELAALRAESPRLEVARDAAGQVTHLSRLEGRRGEARGPVAAALSFLEAHRSLFALDQGYVLALRRAPPDGVTGSVRLARELGGLPVMRSDLVVTVDGAGRVLLVNQSPLPPVPAGYRERPTIGRRDAERLAAKVLSGVAARGTGEAGYLAQEGRLVPAVTAVVFVNGGREVRRVYLHGVSGEMLGSHALSENALGSVWEISPAALPGAECPAQTKQDSFEPALVYDWCAPIVNHPLGHLTSTTRLSGATAAAYNCKGGYYGNASDASCIQTVQADGNGDFIVAPDPTHRAVDDGMSEVMAYDGVDRTDTYLRSLDPDFAGTGYTPGFTNTFDQDPNGAGLIPFENAQSRAVCSSQFAGPCMVFGQAYTTDTAYDEEVVYHEMTHSAVRATAGFIGPSGGAYGAVQDPGAVNEGTADTFSVAMSDDPQMGEYFASDVAAIANPDGGAPFSFIIGPRGSIRDVSLFHTCKGDTRMSPGGFRANPGMDSEVHDDGEIWGDFTWELHQGLAGVNALAVQGGAKPPTCSGTPCNAAAVAAFRALEAQPSTPTFHGYASSVAAMVRSLYGAAAGDYADCVVERHDMAGCDDRAVPVYATEGKDGYYYAGDYLYGGSRGSVPAFQTTFETDGTGSLQINACAAYGKGTIYLRHGQPVTLASGVPSQYDWFIPVKTRMFPCLKTDPATGKPYQTTITIDANGCFFEGWDTSSTANDANPPKVASTACAVRGGQKLASGTWYVLNSNSANSATAGGALFSGFRNFAIAGVKARPAGAPRDCAALRPAGGTCVPVCDGVRCGDPDGCGGSCTSAGHCVVPLADGGLCEPLCLGIPCGTNDTCGGTCQSGSGCLPTDGGACDPVCAGVACGGSDGCGGTCTLNCDAGCTPSCTGKACNAGDGCGGKCTAGCAGDGGGGADAGPKPDGGGGATTPKGCGCGAGMNGLFALAGLGALRRRRK